jgi:hypothetical protein
VIHLLARFQRTPNSLAKVARMVSPLTRSLVKPSSKLACAADSKVHKLVGLPKSLGLRWSICRKRSAPSESKARWMVCALEDPFLNASRRPPSLKAWMALRAVWGLHPKERAI